jgi:hypothetical protein
MWAIQQIPDPGQRALVGALVLIGLNPWPSLWRARSHYAMLAQSLHWDGGTATHVWRILEACLKGAEADDIPF